MKDRQITAGQQDLYAELGVEHPREAFDRLTGGAFTDRHHERLVSMAALAGLLSLALSLSLSLPALLS